MTLEFTGFTHSTIDFMWNLRLNNNKPWFEAHKDDFISNLQIPMKALGREVFDRICDDFGDRGFIHKVSRIYKDARRVRNGEPYKTGLWFSFEKPNDEWTATPVFWFDLSPDNWSYGMGYGGARAETMAKLRARIDKNPKEFEHLIAPLDEQQEFVLDGADYVRKKEAPTAKTAAWYNKKSFSLMRREPIGDQLFSSKLVNRLVKGYTFLMPFYDYLITLDSDNSPNVEKK